MQKDLTDHERDSELMASKLNSMKMQLMENETSYGLRRKFGCVRLSGVRILSCTVSTVFNLKMFMQIEITNVLKSGNQYEEYFMLIDSLEGEININFEHIEQFVYVE